VSLLIVKNMSSVCTKSNTNFINEKYKKVVYFFVEAFSE